MIRSYFRILNDEIQLPSTTQDIRKIYDDITAGEIDVTELPDGKIFRKEITYSLKKSGTGKVVHHGITPGEDIIRAIEHLLEFMNTDDSPMIIKVAIGHYYFGYIHPFYDGNSRTSRFISSMYLTEMLGNVASLF